MKRTIFALASLTLIAVGSAVTLDVQATDGADGWGAVKGQIIWGGKEVPKPQELKVTKDMAHCLGDGPIYDTTWVINDKNKGVRDVFIWLEPLDPKGEPLAIHPSLQKVPQEKILMDQPRCAFIPYAVAMREGQVLVAKNSSPIVHNYKYGGHPNINPGGNPLMPPNAEVTIKNLKADKLPIRIECSIHGWMAGWVRVFDHPYYAVTDANGNFEIKNAPAGKCRIKIWHSTGWLGGVKGRMGQEIAIDAGKATDLGALKIGGK
jgi:hypothetical protein